MTINPAATGPKSYDVHGFQITSAPVAPSATAAVQADAQATTTTNTLLVEKQNGADRSMNRGYVALGAFCGIMVGGMMIL
jgi:hypothetical protein